MFFQLLFTWIVCHALASTTEAFFDPCKPNPCAHGSCLLNPTSPPYSCTCYTGWTGLHCYVTVTGTCLNISDHLNVQLNKCYRLIQGPWTMLEGYEQCRMIPTGQIIEIEDQDSLNQAKTQVSGDTWIGIFDMEIGDTWEDTWVYWDGSPVTWTNWRSGQPNNNPSPQECLIIDGSGGWSDRKCDETYDVLCEYNAIGGITLPDNDTTQTEGADTSVFYFSSLDITAWLESEAMNASEAQATCNTFGGHLITIDGCGKSDLVFKSIFNSSCIPTWIGISHKNTTGSPNTYSHNWITWGGSALTWTNWYSTQNEGNNKQPNNKPRGQECVRVGKHCKWFDRSCSDVYPFVCERKGMISPSSSLVQTRTRLTVSGQLQPQMCDCYARFYEPLGKCYWKTEEKGSIGVSFDQCGHNGGRLASLPNRNLSDFLFREILDSRDEVWVGLSYYPPDGPNPSGWMDWNSSPVVWTDWESDQPNDLNKRQCAMVRKDGWSDKDCPTNYQALCEKEAYYPAASFTTISSYLDDETDTSEAFSSTDNNQVNQVTTSGIIETTTIQDSSPTDEHATTTNDLPSSTETTATQASIMKQYYRPLIGNPKLRCYRETATVTIDMVRVNRKETSHYRRQITCAPDNSLFSVVSGWTAIAFIGLVTLLFLINDLMTCYTRRSKKNTQTGESTRDSLEIRKR